MKKKRQIKELKAEILSLVSRLFAANQDVDKWKDSSEYWENQYNTIQKVGMLLVKASDYKILLDGSLKAGQYKKALAEKEQLLHESNVTKDALKERLTNSNVQIASLVTLLKEIAQLLEMDEHAVFVDIPKNIENLCANFAHANSRAEGFLADNVKQRDKVDAQKHVIEGLHEQINMLNQVENRDNECYEKNRESQLFTAEYYRLGEEIRELKEQIEQLKPINLNLDSSLANILECKNNRVLIVSKVRELKAENKKLSNLLEPQYMQDINKDRPCAEKEKSFCADCGLVCNKNSE